MPSPWPHAARAAISITLDNMGEAADLNRNLWPASEPVGKHHSVMQQLPQLLDLLDKHGITATYFIEAWNVAHYADAMREVALRGHEVAWHGFQHEAWAKLGVQEEEGNFERSVGCIEQLGMRYQGFRPPGGRVTGRTLGLMRGYGMQYVSPAAERAAVVKGVVVLPFAWSNIDAYYYLDTFGGLREMKGDRGEVMTAEELVTRFIGAVDEVVEKGGYLALLFHPFLQTDSGRLKAVDEVLKYVAAKDGVWRAPCNQVADWITEHADDFSDDPLWDTSSWR